MNIFQNICPEESENCGVPCRSFEGRVRVDLCSNFDRVILTDGHSLIYPRIYNLRIRSHK